MRACTRVGRWLHQPQIDRHAVAGRSCPSIITHPSPPPLQVVREAASAGCPVQPKNLQHHHMCCLKFHRPSAHSSFAMFNKHPPPTSLPHTCRLYEKLQAPAALWNYQLTAPFSCLCAQHPPPSTPLPQAVREAAGPCRAVELPALSTVLFAVTRPSTHSHPPHRTHPSTAGCTRSCRSLLRCGTTSPRRPSPSPQRPQRTPAQQPTASPAAAPRPPPPMACPPPPLTRRPWAPGRPSCTTTWEVAVGPTVPAIPTPTPTTLAASPRRQSPLPFRCRAQPQRAWPAARTATTAATSPPPRRPRRTTTTRTTSRPAPAWTAGRTPCPREPSTCCSCTTTPGAWPAHCERPVRGGAKGGKLRLDGQSKSCHVGRSAPQETPPPLWRAAE